MRVHGVRALQRRVLVDDVLAFVADVGRVALARCLYGFVGLECDVLGYSPCAPCRARRLVRYWADGYRPGRPRLSTPHDFAFWEKPRRIERRGRHI